MAWSEWKPFSGGLEGELIHSDNNTANLLTGSYTFTEGGTYILLYSGYNNGLKSYDITLNGETLNPFKEYVNYVDPIQMTVVHANLGDVLNYTYTNLGGRLHNYVYVLK